MITVFGNVQIISNFIKSLQLKMDLLKISKSMANQTSQILFNTPQQHFPSIQMIRIAIFKDRFLHNISSKIYPKKFGVNTQRRDYSLKTQKTIIYIIRMFYHLKLISYFDNIKNRYPKLSEVFLTENSYLWLLKPADMNRGNGVHVFRTLGELENLIDQYCIGQFQDEIQDRELFTRQNMQKMDQQNNIRPFSSIEQKLDDQDYENNVKKNNLDIPQKLNNKKGFYLKCKQFVIQKYLEKPLLYQGRKFDIRVWALVTQEMQVFFFKEGYLRTSCEKFNLDDVLFCYYISEQPIYSPNQQCYSKELKKIWCLGVWKLNFI